MDLQESETHGISLSPASKEVAYTISGYATKNIKHFQYEICSLVMVRGDSDDAIEMQCFDILCRGDLTVPSSEIAVSLYACFAIQINCYADKFIGHIINPLQVILLK